jgi:hypothetical protein
LGCSDSLDIAEPVESVTNIHEGIAVSRGEIVTGDGNQGSSIVAATAWTDRSDGALVFELIDVGGCHDIVAV